MSLLKNLIAMFRFVLLISLGLSGLLAMHAALAGLAMTYQFWPNLIACLCMYVAFGAIALCPIRDAMKMYSEAANESHLGGFFVLCGCLYAFYHVCFVFDPGPMKVFTLLKWVAVVVIFIVTLLVYSGLATLSDGAGDPPNPQPKRVKPPTHEEWLKMKKAEKEGKAKNGGETSNPAMDWMMNFMVLPPVMGGLWAWALYAVMAVMFHVIPKAQRFPGVKQENLEGMMVLSWAFLGLLIVRNILVHSSILEGGKPRGSAERTWKEWLTLFI